MNKHFLWSAVILSNLIGLGVAQISIAGEAIPENFTSESAEYHLTTTPLSQQLFTQPTAQHLQRGEFIVNFDNRLYFLPDLVVGGVDDADTAVNFNTGFVWGISDKLQLALQFLFLDSSSPAKQGNFISERTENQAAAGELKYQLWQNESQTQALSGVVSASWGTRGFRFTREGTRMRTEINNRNVFVALAFPYTAQMGKWQFTISPTVAFFNDRNAGFFHRIPGEDEEFGTVFGLTGSAAYEINPRLFIWGDVFAPFTGNNSVSRSSGKPDTAIAYNGGIRYLVNPRLALDIYASNTFGSYGPISLTADRDLVALGTNLTFMPDFIGANRKYGDRFDEEDSVVTPLTTDGLAFFDGGVVSPQDFVWHFQAGNQGILTALRYGFVKDLEAAIYLDYIFGDVDESEQGYAVKVRLLNQAESAPITLSLAATLSITNQPFVNFLEADRDEFERRDLDKEFPIFTPGGDDIEEGKQLIATFALPIHYQIANNTAVWFTPIVGYLQREGTELGGFNLGGSLGFSSELSAVAEVGANFIGEGNTISQNGLEDEIPWTFALRWTPLSLLGLENTEDNTNPQLEFYLTNRVGSSTWHQLRVRDDNDLAIGVGLQLPF